MESTYPSQLVGWLVWGKVKSLPWWPGQVMHPSKGPPEVRKMAAMKSNSGKLLVMFMGRCRGNSTAPRGHHGAQFPRQGLICGTSATVVDIPWIQVTTNTHFAHATALWTSQSGGNGTRPQITRARCACRNVYHECRHQTMPALCVLSGGCRWLATCEVAFREPGPPVVCSVVR